MSLMKTVTFSQLRNNAKRYFDAVEGGETLEVYRHGKPIALLSPARERTTLRWGSSRPLRLPGISLSEAILADRSESR